MIRHALETHDGSLVWQRDATLAGIAMHWRGLWSQGHYEFGDVVVDNTWTMVCTNPNGTNERPSPQSSGEPFWVSGLGDSPTWGSDSYPSVAIMNAGQRYTWAADAWAQAARVWVDSPSSSIEYTLIAVVDPEGPEPASAFVQFFPTATGWAYVDLSDALFSAGTVVDLFVRYRNLGVTAPLIADYNYVTPNGNGTPNPGVIRHRGNRASEMKIHYTDDKANDNTAALQALGPGDTIQRDDTGQVWVIESKTNESDHIDCVVSPATTSGPDGVTTFTITNEPDVTIDVPNIADHYTANTQVEGGAQEVYDPATFASDQDAYAVDLMVQGAVISPDWEAVAYSGGGSVAPPSDPGGGGLAHSEMTVIAATAATNLNTAAPGVAVVFDGVSNTIPTTDNGDFTHDTGGNGGITCNFDGAVRVTSHVDHETSTAWIGLFMRIVWFPAAGGVINTRGGDHTLIRSSNGNDFGMCTMTTTLTVSDGDRFEVWSQQNGVAGTVTLRTYYTFLTVERIE